MTSEDIGNLTIVIPTLPRRYMNEWIEQIKGYVDFGCHVMIVIPPGFSVFNLGDALSRVSRLNVVTAERVGQVAQRAYGLSKVETEFVMQMDDDIILDKKDILRLIGQLESLGKSACIAPRLARFPSGNELQSHPDFKTVRGIIRYLLAIFVYGARQLRVTELYGKITKSGYGYGVPSRLELSCPLEVEWLPGGCIMYRKEHAIAYDYYPFTGKAYAEDLLFSHLLKKQGVKLYYSNDVIALTPPVVPSDDLRTILSFAKEHRARLAYVKMSGGDVIYLYFTYVWRILNEAFSHLLRRVCKIRIDVASWRVP